MNLSFTLLILFTIGTGSTDSFDTIMSEQQNCKSDSSFNDYIQKTDTISIANSDTTLDFAERVRVVLINQEAETSKDHFKDILPFLTLILGIGIPKILEYFSKRKKLKSVLKRWIAEIRILVNPLHKQIEDLEKFINEVKEDRNDIPDMGVNAILKGEIFKTLDKGEFLDALEKINQIKYPEAVHLANRTHGVTQILSHYSEMLQHRFDEYMNIVGKLVDELNENTYNLQKAFNQYSVQIEKSIKGDPIQDEAYSKMGNLIFNHLLTPSINGESKQDIFTLEKVFFLPMLEILAQKRLDERTSNILEFTSTCVRILHKIRSEKIIISGSIAQIQQELKLQSEEIQTVINILDKRK